jgi:hypothetical protein
VRLSAVETMDVEALAHSPKRVRFGVFEVDLRAGELWKSGRKRKLTGHGMARRMPHSTRCIGGAFDRAALRYGTVAYTVFSHFVPAVFTA